MIYNREFTEWTRLQQACVVGTADECAADNPTLVDDVDFILATGGDVHERTTNGNTPLHLACINGAADLVAYLIDEGADIDATNDDLEAPLHHAVQTRSIEAVELLLAAGVDLDLEDIDCQTPLHWAMDRAGEGCEIVRSLIDAGANISAQDFNNNTPLHLAAAEGAVEAVEILLAHGCKIAWTNIVGCTSFLSAVARDQVEVVKYMVERDNSLWGTLLGATNCTALHVAASENSLDVLDYMLGRLTLAEITAVDAKGRTALNLADCLGYKSAVELLATKEAAMRESEMLIQTLLTTSRPSWGCHKSVKVGGRPAWAKPAPRRAAVTSALRATA